MSKDLSKRLCELCGIEKTVDFTKPEIIKLERTQFSITKEVKQSIREAEWVYE